MTTYPIGEAMTETFTGTVAEMRVDRADDRCADCDDGDECCGCCESTFRTTPGLYLTVRLDDDRVGLHAGRVRVTYESPDQPEPVKPSREDVARVLYGQFTSNRIAEWEDIDDDSDEPRSGYLAAADAVLALLPDRCAPTEEEVTALLFNLYDHGTSPDAKRETQAVLSLFGSQPTVREAKAEGWAEGKSAAVNVHPSWWSTLTNPYRSAAATTGYRSAAATTGADCISAALGWRGYAKAAVGSGLVVAEHDNAGHLLGVRAVIVDGTEVKGDTWYALRGGLLVEVDAGGEPV